MKHSLLKEVQTIDLQTCANDVWMEFHVSRKARNRYQFDETLFATNGKVILANFTAARQFAHKINEKRDLISFPEQAVKASHINAMGLIDELLHFMIYLYRQHVNPKVVDELRDWLTTRFKAEHVDDVLLEFVKAFPPMAVYRGKMTPEEYLAQTTIDRPNRQLVLEEMFVLWLQNSNPAIAPYIELIDDADLEKKTHYRYIIESIHEFFESQPPPLTGHRTLIELLQEPIRMYPHSLVDQLERLRQFLIRVQEQWHRMLRDRKGQPGDIVDVKLLYRPLTAIDFIREEQERAPFMGAQAPTEVASFWGMEHEPEKYSVDLDWMPRVVMIAKNTYVWLDQLSKKYQRDIRSLDQIPDEELDTLSRRGFTTLWLIGVWERSHASKKIKQLCGNPEAVASAYSLMSYQIAADLGGQAAYDNLNYRAQQRGIRLAGDMVPNHMSIDSDWVRHHPDWFVGMDHPPFPSYTFNGPNLSEHGDVTIQIEDKYYSRQDAAVVFRRIDNHTGETRYIYHGNDGTNMPWNDTAQLNYLKPEVREAVIQTILDVARRFSVIRFDAAMTLAKKHYQRLWFPQPGSGGDIPSRSAFAMTRHEFDQHIPIEFWREVVDRVAQETPNTLLLAEAFWLMEGYFVRTLGMHRVYNSAFMNMLRNEENAKYRQTIKNILEFDPEILKRHVNFMNNPDEETAVAQFGKGDKYFGICVLMITMPGLPMFGHGQVEGFTEKYGMEYRRAYYDEWPDDYLVNRHEQEIFPLLKKRYIFADVRNFYLFGFWTTDGHVNEDVFAYSNAHGNERALVVYHNKFGTVRGWVRHSARYLVKHADGNQSFEHKTLSQALELHVADDYYCIYRDMISGLEYISPTRELAEKGMYLELDAYKYRVFANFRTVQDDAEQHYRQLAEYLAGRGVYSIERALTEIVMRPIHPPFRKLVNGQFFNNLIDARLTKPDARLKKKVIKQVETDFSELLDEVKNMFGFETKNRTLISEITRKLDAVLRLPILSDRYPLKKSKPYQSALKLIDRKLDSQPANWGTVFSWLFVHNLGKLERPKNGYAEISRGWFDEWLLSRIVEEALHALTGSHEQHERLDLIRILVSYQNWFDQIPPAPSAKVEKGGKKAPTPKQTKIRSAAYRLMSQLLKDPDVQKYLNVNRFQEVLWFKDETFDELVEWLFVLAVIDVTSKANVTRSKAPTLILERYEVIRQLQEAKAKSDHQVEKLLAALETEQKPQKATPKPRKKAKKKAK